MINQVLLKISDEQLRKLDAIVDYHSSDRVKIIRRCKNILYNTQPRFTKTLDSGMKNNKIGIRFSDEDMEELLQLSNYYEQSIPDLLRFGIDMQYLPLRDLEKLENKIIFKHNKL